MKVHGKPIFEELYADDAKLGEFLGVMTGFQAASFMLLGEKFDFSKYKTVSDIGGALGLLSHLVGKRHPHLTFTTFDLPPVEPLARKHIDEAGMSDRIKVVSGDFFRDELPKADVVTRVTSCTTGTSKRRSCSSPRPTLRCPKAGRSSPSRT